jgi:hypothetical protein
VTLGVVAPPDVVPGGMIVAPPTAGAPGTAGVVTAPGFTDGVVTVPEPTDGGVTVWAPAAPAAATRAKVSKVRFIIVLLC